MLKTCYLSQFLRGNGNRSNIGGLQTGQTDGTSTISKKIRALWEDYAVYPGRYQHPDDVYGPHLLSDEAQSYLEGTHGSIYSDMEGS